MSNPSKLAFVLVLAVFLPTAGSALADTLELNDGNVIEGTYLGGNAENIRFRTEGRVQVFRIDEVFALNFSDPGSGGSAMSQSETVEIVLPAGTSLRVVTLEDIDSEQNGRGDRFACVLDQDVVRSGQYVIPRGAEVQGEVVEARRGGPTEGEAMLELEITNIDVNGSWEAIRTSTVTRSRPGRWSGVWGPGGSVSGTDNERNLAYVSRGTSLSFRLMEPLHLWVTRQAVGYSAPTRSGSSRSAFH